MTGFGIKRPETGQLFIIADPWALRNFRIKKHDCFFLRAGKSPVLFLRPFKLAQNLMFLERCASLRTGLVMFRILS